MVLGKNPYEFVTGDTTVSRLVAQLASESFSVQQVALTQRQDLLGQVDQVIGIRKPPVNKMAILGRSILTARSPVHERFDVKELQVHLLECSADAFVAEHSYMAESALSAGIPRDKIYVNTHVSESDVQRNSGATAGKLLSHWLLRDELRVATRSKRVACFDMDELLRYKTRGIRNVEFLPLTLPPEERATIGDSTEQLIFVGDQSWLPNRQAIEKLQDLWPRIRDQVPSACLRIVGKPDSTPRRWDFDQSVQFAGFVDDLDEALRESRAMIAPIAVGGGVRVKLLEAAARGLPIVSTSAGIGALSGLLGISGIDDEEEFIDECVHLLQDRKYAAARGENLFEANRNVWQEQIAARAVESWLA